MDFYLKHRVAPSAWQLNLRRGQLLRPWVRTCALLSSTPTITVSRSTIQPENRYAFHHSIAGVYKAECTVQPVYKVIL